MKLPDSIYSVPRDLFRAVVVYSDNNDQHYLFNAGSCNTD